MKVSPDLTSDSYGAVTDRCLRVPGPRDAVSVHVSRSLHGRPRFPVVLPLVLAACENFHLTVGTRTAQQLEYLQVLRAEGWIGNLEIFVYLVSEPLLQKVDRPFPIACSDQYTRSIT